jgi:hypothetical protein
MLDGECKDTKIPSKIPNSVLSLLLLNQIEYDLFYQVHLTQLLCTGNDFLSIKQY